MKNILLFALLLGATTLSAQWTVSFHQSFLPFAGLGYGFGDRFRLEARVGTDLDFNSVTAEGVVLFDILDNEDYELYAGLGGHTNDPFNGLVIPVGLNIYPFAEKRFGFHIELAGLFGIPFDAPDWIDENTRLRGSWGIRYRFLNE
jgi:hypothetical protein